MRLVIDHGHEALGEGSDVASPTGSRQSNHAPFAVYLGGIKVPETVPFGRAQEA
jgi:hypothetical protein